MKTKYKNRSAVEYSVNKEYRYGIIKAERGMFFWHRYIIICYTQEHWQEVDKVKDKNIIGKIMRCRLPRKKGAV